MHVLLALAAAAGWGSSDFVAGLTERRSPGTTVALTAQITGLLLLLGTAPLVGGHATVADLGWGAAAGLGGAVGLMLLYRALAAGTMGVVAPVTAAVAATLPVVFGVATGERPPPVALAGVAVAVASVVLISMAPGPSADRPAADAPRDGGGAGVVAVLSGLAFGAYFVCIAQVGEDAGLWPLLAARSSAVQLLCLLAAAKTGAVAVDHLAGGWAVGVGALDAAANVAFLLASRLGLLSVTALLASLYPVVTVALARVVLGERLSGGQSAGLGGALAAVALIALG